MQYVRWYSIIEKRPDYRIIDRYFQLPNVIHQPKMAPLFWQPLPIWGDLWHLTLAQIISFLLLPHQKPADEVMIISE